MFTIKCQMCGAASPITRDEDEVVDLAVDAGWEIEGNDDYDRDLCPSCASANNRTRNDYMVGPDGKCPMTRHPCTCIPKSLGHWCAWSIPRTPEEAYRATMGLGNETETK